MIRRVDGMGLMSVTFRSWTPERIVALARDIGCSLVAWSGDVHVPLGDERAAREVARRTSDAELEVESYASYWRATGDPDPWIATARSLGATRMRIWAGELASAHATDGDRARVADAIARAADAAALVGIELALEFHRNTLTDTLDSTTTLLTDVAVRRARSVTPVRTLWQPRHGIDPTTAAREVGRLAPALAAIHVFTWTLDGDRRPLAEGVDLWSSVLDATRELRPRVPLMLEFVRGDDAVQCVADAGTLRGWVGGVDGHGAG